MGVRFWGVLLTTNALDGKAESVRRFRHESVSGIQRRKNARGVSTRQGAAGI